MTKEKFYKNLGLEENNYSLERLKIDILRDKKWVQVLKSARFFKYLPFIDLVFVAGSMAIGNVKEDSDFDLVIGTKENRLYTARFLALIFFMLTGAKRRKNISSGKQSKNKLCFNHFVTPNSYKFSPPYNIYWQELYQNLVPIYGEEKIINQFFNANDWSGKRYFLGDLRHNKDVSIIKLVIEKILAGKLGDFLEKILAYLQIQKINNGLKNETPGFKPRIKINQEELELYLSTSKIQKLIS